MNKLFVVALLSISCTAVANTVEITNCEAQSTTHRMELRKTSEGVDIRFEEVSSSKYPDTSRGGPSYKVTGKSITLRTIHGITLQEISRNSKLLTEPIVSILRSRPEFDGEADMSYADANAFIERLVCK